MPFKINFTLAELPLYLTGTVIKKYKRGESESALVLIQFHKEEV